MRREPCQRDERGNEQYAADADRADQEADESRCEEELRTFGIQSRA